jgi:hypothetical protein
MKSVIKFCLASGLAFLILNSLCFAYYNVPVLFPSETGVTDGHLEANAFYVRAVEGYGYGKLNNEGFNNFDDYYSKNIDILMMGSSHMEAMQVAQAKTTSAILGKMFNREKYVYNIALGAQTISGTIKHFEKAIDYYTPKEFAVIETQDIKIPFDDLDAIVHEQFGSILSSRLAPNPNPIRQLMMRLQYSFLRKMPYIRLVAYQINTVMSFSGDQEKTETGIFEKERYAELLNSCMERLHRISVEYDISLIIFYHPHMKLLPDGSVIPDTNTEYLDMFGTACTNNNIHFLDMTVPFLLAYQERYILPHGFNNTQVGMGHLNENGHKIIAEELYNRIQAVTEGGIQ